MAKRANLAARQFIILVGIGIALILAGLTVLQYHFEITFFALQKFRDYFFTCDTNLLPRFQGMIAMHPPCIRDYFFNSYYAGEGIAITALLLGGIGSLIYAAAGLQAINRRKK